MQDEIVARLAGALNAELVAAEAGRAEQTPTPDSMDLYFQGWALLNKGMTRDNVAQGRDFFDRALAADPNNVDALIGSAAANAIEGSQFYAANPAAAFASAEPKVIRALSVVPDHARGHALLGFVKLWTGRANEGIAELEHALALDRNLADARAGVGFGKIFIGRAEDTETDVAEALRLSLRDTLAYAWMVRADIAKLALGNCKEAVAWFRRAIEANRNFVLSHFWLAAALAELGRVDEAHSAVKAGLGSTQPSPFPAPAPSGSR
jgi:tetratricopeptide (TPR) repeat protein